MAVYKNLYSDLPWMKPTVIVSYIGLTLFLLLILLSYILGISEEPYMYALGWILTPFSMVAGSFVAIDLLHRFERRYL